MIRVEGAHAILALELDAVGQNLWAADAGGFISALYFDLAAAKLNLIRRFVLYYCYSNFFEDFSVNSKIFCIMQLPILGYAFISKMFALILNLSLGSASAKARP